VIQQRVVELVVLDIAVDHVRCFQCLDNLLVCLLSQIDIVLVPCILHAHYFPAQRCLAQVDFVDLRKQIS
jgi:hypothetical protein